MKRIFLITLASLLILLSSHVSLTAQGGRHAFKRGYKLVEKQKYEKAGDKFFKAYYRDYFPGFEPLTYAVLAYNAEGYNTSAKICFKEAEVDAYRFASIYKHIFEEIPVDYDTIFDFWGETLYDALYTIADTNAAWKEYELKEAIDLMLYAGATVYADEAENDTALFYTNIGLKYNADPDLYIIKGDVWLEMGQADSALNAYSSAYDLSPEDVYANCGIGEAYYAKEEYGAAMEHYNRTLEIDPVNTWGLTCKAELLSDMHEYDKALELYDMLIELYPSFYPSYFSRAGVYFDLDRYEEAIEDYKLYLVFDPDDEDAQYNLDAAEENLWGGYDEW